MIRLTRTAAVVLTILAAAQTFPAPAEAQLGSLARKARQAVQDKAEEKVEDAIPFTPLPAPEFTDDLLEVTEERAAKMIEAFDAEIAYSKKASKEYKALVKAHEDAMKEYEKALVPYQRQDSVYQACRTAFEEKEEAASAANEAKVNKALEEMDDEEFEAYMEDLAIRGEEIAQEALANQNTMDPAMRARHEAYQKEVAAMVAEQNRRMALVMSGQIAERRRAASENPRLVKECGEAPVAPVRPQSELTSPEGLLAQVGAETAGLTPRQYAIMRERVLYWSDENGRPSGMGYSEGEMSALGTVKVRLEEVVKGMRKAKIPA